MARVLLAVLLAFVAVASAQFVSGHWRSSYGDPVGQQAPWYICIVPNPPNYKFYATYSRIGYVEGDILAGSLNTMSGKFYEAGFTFTTGNTQEQLGGFYGTISLTLVNSSYISGTYNDVISGPGTWEIYNVDNVAPDPTLCWSSVTPLTQGSIPNNGWVNASAAANWDFCAATSGGSGVSNVESAYDFADPPNGDTTGASFGACYDADRTCTFLYVEKIGGTPNKGQWLMHQVDASTFYAFGWTDYPNTEDPSVAWYQPTVDNFGFYIWSKGSGLSGACDRYNSLYSSSTSLVASLLFVVAALLLGLAL
jgi:hypothetical protein